MTTSPNQQKTISDMIELCNSKLIDVKAAREAGFRTGFFLVIQDGQMVVCQDNNNVFRLNGADPASGYEFDTFTKAKRAAHRWNDALNEAQRAAHCQVHAVSHAQYLEYIEVACTRLINTLSGHAVKN